MKREEILKAFDSFNGDMYIRSLKVDNMIHGFFTDRDMLKVSLKALPDDLTLYFNSQIISEEFKSKIPINEFKGIKKGCSLKDADVEKMRYLILDIDVASKNTASKDEHGKMLATTEENIDALNLAKKIKTDLEAAGFVDMGIANSGNGAYVIIPMRKKSVSKELSQIIGNFIHILNQEFAENGMHIDSKTINPARIFKVPGTLSTKGKATDELPYRHAEIIEKFGYSHPNSWKLIQAYIDNYGYATDLLISDSKGGIKFDLDAVCIQATIFFDAYCDQYGTMYVQATKGDDNNIYRIDSEDCNTAIRKWIRKCTNKGFVPPYVVDAAKTMLADVSRESDVVYLNHRICAKEGEVLYNLGNNQVVRVTPQSVTIEECPRKTFLEGDSDDIQVTPDLSVKPTELRDLVKPFFNIVENKDWILLLGFLGSCYMGNMISHPILYISGEKGSAKSTATRMLQSIVSPKQTGLCRLPSSERDLGIILSKELFMAFDNMGGIKNNVGDLLCQAVTGGTAIERKLYTNNEIVRNGLKTILVMNGLNLLTNKEDLLDRVIIINLERISNSTRKTDKDIETAFAVVKSKILGALFNAVKEVMSLEIKPIEHKIRLVDFEELAIKFAIAFGWTQAEAEKAFYTNKEEINLKVIEENPITEKILLIMEGENKIIFKASDLYKAVCGEIPKAGMPQSASAFMRKLGNLRSDLESVGITFESKNNGFYKEVSLHNNGDFVINKSRYKKATNYKLYRSKVPPIREGDILGEDEEDE